MIYIFEDNSDADISVLYKKAYDKDIIHKFVYAEGNGRIKENVNNYLSITSEKIVVFMDTIPGNKDCFRIYSELSYISRNNNYRVVVLPIICAEYYMIKSIKNKQLFIDKEEVDNCINKHPHILSKLLKYPDKAKYCRNFEKYCKYILKYNVNSDCLKPYSKEKDINGEYYRKDCECEKFDFKCKESSLLNKAVNLLIEYKYVPSGSGIQAVKDLTEEELWDVHKILVDEYNQFVDVYKAADEDSFNNKYRKLKYIL